MYLWQFVIYMYRNNSKSKKTKKQNETLCISYLASEIRNTKQKIIDLTWNLLLKIWYKCNQILAESTCTHTVVS